MPISPIELRYTSITISWNDLTGEQVSYRDIFKRLEHYSLVEILDYIGRISVVLSKSPVHLPKGIEGQKRIFQGLLGTKGTLPENIVRFEQSLRQEGHLGPVVLFYHQQLLTLTKLAFLALDPKAHVGGSSESPRKLGESLLMTTDLIWKAFHHAETNTTLEREKHQVREMEWLANGILNLGQNPVHAFARHYELYLADDPDLQEHPDYINLPMWVNRATGLDLDTMWSILWAFNARWLAMKSENIHKTSVFTNKYSLFSNYAFTHHQIDKFFSLVSVSVHEMKQLINDFYRPTNLRPYHFLPIAQYPIVEFEDNAILLSTSFLQDKLTTGLHHLFLSNTFTNAEKEQFLRFLGHRFERYCNFLINDIADRLNLQFIKESDIRIRTPGKCCDSIVYEKNTDVLILLEYKAPLLTLPARTGESHSDFMFKVQNIILDGSRQIDETINAILNGAISDLVPTLSNETTLIPVIATLERLPMNTLFYRKFRKEIYEEGLFKQRQASALEVIDVSEVERLQVIAEHGTSICAVLAEKLSHPNTSEVSLNNFLSSNYPRQGSANSRLLRLTYKRLSQKMFAIFKDNER